MKILSFVHGYPPSHNAGAEWMLHTINKFLLSQGHEVKVMVRGGDIPVSKNGKTSYKKVDKVKEFEGVEMIYDTQPMYYREIDWADIVITHLNLTGKAINVCKLKRKPLVHLIHNTHRVHELDVINPMNQYIVYNSQWVKDELRYKQRSVVLYPPVMCDDYKVNTKRTHYTLINCWGDKGGQVLVDLANAMTGRNFLGVLGGYGDQVVGKGKNLTYMKNTPDIKKVYRKTKVLLMPSKYESWGRTAVEAMCSGIPVIAHPTPGLKESLGDAGIFCDREDVGQWVKAINDLDNEEYYKEVSAKCKDRAKELTATTHEQLVSLEKFLESIKSKGYEV